MELLGKRRLVSVSIEIEAGQRLTLTKMTTPRSNCETGREVDDAAGGNKDGVRLE
jgi:hypothetical protein